MNHLDMESRLGYTMSDRGLAMLGHRREVRSLASALGTLVLLSIAAPLPFPSSARGETVVAVGSAFSPVPGSARAAEEPFVIRILGTRFEYARMPSGLRGRILGVTSAGPKAWAFGVTDGNTPLVLTSNDEGRTWEAFSLPVPADQPYGEQIVGAAFSSEASGTFVLTDMAGFGPLLLTTGDGGTSWDVDASARVSSHAQYFVIASRQRTVLFRRDEFGPRAIPLSGGSEVDDSLLDRPRPASPFARDSSAGGSFLLPEPDAVRVSGPRASFWPRATAVFGDAMWVAGSLAGTAHRAAIYATSDGTAWELQAPSDPSLSWVQCIDFDTPERGLAGGVKLTPGGPEPFILYTSDGGSGWDRAQLPNAAAGLEITSIVHSGGVYSWASARSAGETGGLFLQSGDGGRSWRAFDDYDGTDRVVFGLYRIAGAAASAVATVR